MAGSYNHVVKKDGSLAKPDRVLGMLDCHHGDVYEAIEEMYGMIWYLAEECLYAEYDYPPVHPDQERAELVEMARKKYLQGLYISPTKRFESPGLV